MVGGLLLAILRLGRHTNYALLYHTKHTNFIMLNHMKHINYTVLYNINHTKNTLITLYYDTMTYQQHHPPIQCYNVVQYNTIQCNTILFQTTKLYCLRIRNSSYQLFYWTYLMTLQTLNFSDMPNSLYMPLKGHRESILIIILWPWMF